ncbi:prolyl-tRNA synthetase associated domain-containing protein [Gammaproteobacteria bacterium]|nr:prolyl-tRNA synthetase associated domain-containing protein [Gammaproteobacteria bacterium]
MTTPFALKNGTAPADSQTICDRIAACGEDVTPIEHPPLRTVDDARDHRHLMPDGGHAKNLLLRNRKGKMWLVTLEESRMIDLASLADTIGAGRLSFASPERLMLYVGVVPGAVSPLSLINDHEQAVEFVLDHDLLAQSPLHFHPGRNDLTVRIQPQTLLAYCKAIDHPARIVDLSTMITSTR